MKKRKPFHRQVMTCYCLMCVGSIGIVWMGLFCVEASASYAIALCGVLMAAAAFYGMWDESKES